MKKALVIFLTITFPIWIIPVGFLLMFYMVYEYIDGELNDFNQDETTKSNH